MKNILILGATSSIASHCARLWAEKGAVFVLVGRNKNKLNDTALDLKARGALSIETFITDLSDISEHKELIDACFKTLKTIDIVLIAHGTLPDQNACEIKGDLAVKEFVNNGLSVISLLTQVAQKMEKQGQGNIAVISSVAGDRGRASNYLYGSAKAAVSNFCEGLRSRLNSKGVNVTLIKPGFVKTPMTANLDLPQFLIANPQDVAKTIVSSIERRQGITYTPWFWRWIMLIICSIPDFVFKRMKI